MAERGRKILLTAEALLLLLPLTLFTALFVLVSYPAYPIPHPGLFQRVFDAAMLLQVAGIIAGWYLTARYLRAGHSGLGMMHAAWSVLVGVAATIGLLGAIVAVEHMLNPSTAEDYVGFALLAPAAALAPICIHLLMERRRACAGEMCETRRIHDGP